MGLLFDLVNQSLAIDKALAHEDKFTDEEIQDACLYAKRKYGASYPALGEAIIQTIQQQRLSQWTLANAKPEIKRAANA